MATKLDLADAQLIGYAHGKNGYGVEALATSMGMTKAEWEKLKTNYPDQLSVSDRFDLDKFFERGAK